MKVKLGYYVITGFSRFTRNQTRCHYKKYMQSFETTKTDCREYYSYKPEQVEML